MEMQCADDFTKPGDGRELIREVGMIFICHRTRSFITSAFMNGDV